MATFARNYFNMFIQKKHHSLFQSFFCVQKFVNILPVSCTLNPPPFCHLQSSEHFDLCSSRRETLRVSSLRSALAGLLSHDQASPHSQWGLALPVHGVPGVLLQPGRHAETHQEPRGAGIPPWLDHQQHLPLQLTHLKQSSHQLKIKSLKCWLKYWLKLLQSLSSTEIVQWSHCLIKRGINPKLWMWKCSQVIMNVNMVSEPCVLPIKYIFLFIITLNMEPLAPPCGHEAASLQHLSEVTTPWIAIILSFNQFLVFLQCKKRIRTRGSNPSSDYMTTVLAIMAHNTKGSKYGSSASCWRLYVSQLELTTHRSW